VHFELFAGSVSGVGLYRKIYRLHFIEVLIQCSEGKATKNQYQSVNSSDKINSPSLH